MKIIFYSLALTLWLIATTSGYSQDRELDSLKIEQIQKKKIEVTDAEKKALKQEIDRINIQLENKEITAEESENLKLASAERHALNIENKIAILDNQIALVERNGEIDLNDEQGKISIGIGDVEKDGDFILGVKINDGKQSYRKYDRRSSTALVFSFGLNNVITEGQSIDDSPYKIGGSRFTEFGIARKTRVFKESNFLRIKYGFSFQFNGLKPVDNQYFVDTGELTELEVYPLDLDKSKFRLDNLVVPIHFEFGPSKKIEKNGYFRYNIDKQFKAGLGGYMGLKLRSRQKLKYEENGENVQLKLDGTYNTNNFIYGLSGYIGVGDMSLYCKYDLNTIFKDNPIKERNISLGIRWDWD